MLSVNVPNCLCNTFSYSPLFVPHFLEERKWGVKWRRMKASCQFCSQLVFIKTTFLKIHIIYSNSVHKSLCKVKHSNLNYIFVTYCTNYVFLLYNIPTSPQTLGACHYFISLYLKHLICLIFLIGYKCVPSCYISGEIFHKLY